MSLTELRPRIRSDEYARGRVVLYQEWDKQSKLLEDIKRRGITLGVERVIGVEDVG